MLFINRFIILDSVMDEMYSRFVLSCIFIFDNEKIFTFDSNLVALNQFLCFVMKYKCLSYCILVVDFSRLPALVKFCNW